MMSKHLYHKSLIYSFVYSRKMQDNDMTDKKKKYQIKCYYFTVFIWISPAFCLILLRTAGVHVVCLVVLVPFLVLDDSDHW